MYMYVYRLYIIIIEIKRLALVGGDNRSANSRNPPPPPPPPLSSRTTMDGATMYWGDGGVTIIVLIPLNPVFHRLALPTVLDRPSLERVDEKEGEGRKGDPVSKRRGGYPDRG